MSQHKQFIPASIEDRAYWDGVRANPALSGLLERIEKLAAEANPCPNPPSASDYLAARRENDRARIDRWWHASQRTLGALAVRRMLRGIEADDPDDALLNTLWAAATQPTWVVSAHLPGFDLPATDKIVIDLYAADLAADLAEFCETMRPWMDSVSGTLFSRIIHEVDARVLGPYGEGEKVSWEPASTNWAGVCAGCILAACESFAAMGMPREAAKARALNTLSDYLRDGFNEHGECDEGIGYWNYGLANAIRGWMRLSPEEYAATLDHRRLREVGDYPRRAHLYGLAFFGGNDCNLEYPCANWVADVLARSEGQSWLLGWAAASRHATSSSFGFSTLMRTLSCPPMETIGQSEHQDVTFLPDQQTAILRAQTSHGELIGILSGGHNGERHNHNDVGHFSIGIGEDMVVPDLGNRQYAADFFGPKRYTYLATSSRGHNCPLIGGHEQRAGAEAAALLRSWDTENGVLELEAAAAYPPEVGVREWARSLRRTEGANGPAMKITDQFVTSAPNMEIISRVWSSHPIAVESDGRFQLGPLSLSVTPAPHAHTITETDGTAEGLIVYDGRTLYCLDFPYATDGEGKLRTEMTFSSRQS